MTAPIPASPRPSRRRRVLTIVLVGYLLLLGASHLVRRGHRAAEPRIPPDLRVTQVPVMNRDTSGTRSIRLVYRDVGVAIDGAAPLLLLPGSPGNLNNFDALAERLSTRYRVIAPDLPGFGHSERRLPDYSNRSHAHYAAELLRQLDIERAHVLAFSMGGGVALQMVDVAPRRVASIIMLGAIGVQELELLGNYELNHIIHGLQMIGVWLLYEGTPHFGWLDGLMLDLPYARNFYDTDQRPLRGLLRRYEAPMLVLHGRHDPLVPIAAADEHSRIVPHSRRHTFEDNSHFLLWTATDALATQIASFVDDVEQGRAPRASQATPERLAAARPTFSEVGAPPAFGLALVILLALIVVGTFVSEDLTCIVTGLLIAYGRLDWIAGLGACLAGIFFGDLLLYAAGRVLGSSVVRRPPLAWFLPAEALEGAARWFERRGVIVIFLSRFLPGTRLPTYVAAGVVRANFWMFALYFLLAVLLWTPALVGVSVWIGHETISLLGTLHRHSVWLIGALAIMILTTTRVVLPLLSYRGRRQLVGKWRRFTQWEFWPVWIFYVPVIAHILRLAARHRSLSLVTAVNPAIPIGGLIGESKGDILDGFDQAAEWVASYARVPGSVGLAARWAHIEQFMAEHSLEFPIVLKPDVGQRGDGVVIVGDREHAHEVLEAQPRDLLAQEFVGGPEFGIFYLRHPVHDRGVIYSITEKILPHVVGDGHRTLERLILDDPRAICQAGAYRRANEHQLDRVPAAGDRIELVDIGTHCRGALFHDGARVHSPELMHRFDTISRACSGFFFGRYDVRARDAAALMRGVDFKILEVNGLTSEATHIYDPAINLREAYGVLFRQWEHAFAIAAANRERGAQPASWREIVDAVQRYQVIKRAARTVAVENQRSDSIGAPAPE